MTYRDVQKVSPLVTQLPSNPTHKKFLSVRREGTAVVKNFITTAADRKNYSIKFSNLNAVISAGYRVEFRVGTQFGVSAAQCMERRFSGHRLLNSRLSSPAAFPRNPCAT